MNSAKVYWSVCLAIVLVAAYVLLSNPNRLVVNKVGEVEGVLNQTRESIQGARFWLNQASIVETELKDLRAEPERQRALDIEMREFDKEQAEWERKFYAEFPESRPTAVERKVQALRDKADAIEQADFRRFLNRSRVERIAKLEIIGKKIQMHIE